MSESLEERLQSHAQAFDGLLSLIPAKYYYGQDTSDQWRKKKQTKEEAKKAKKAKLDPDSAKSAKDIMDENARKRKREEEEEEEEEWSDLDGVDKERPKEGLKASSKKAKKQKGEDTKQGDGADDEEKDAASDTEQATGQPTKGQAKALKRKEKRELKKAKDAAKRDKKSRKEDKAENAKDDGDALDVNSDVGDDEHSGDEIAPLDVNGLVEEHQEKPPSTASPSSVPDSPNFDVSTGQSAASSTSSIVPSAEAGKGSKAPQQDSKVKSDPAEIKARLQARIEALRAARKADGVNGSQPRTRQDLMEARRKKEEERRAHKKELRRKAREEEQRAREDTLSRLNSPSLTAGAGSPSYAEPENNFSFGRVAFGDGQHMDPSLSTILDPHKRKGPQDPLTALKAAESKRARINGLDEGKRADIEEKDAWLNAKKRVHGEKIRDDTSLLKKTLKRKEKAKKKSEKEWTERIEGVKKGQEIRQRKREDNLRKRKEEKGQKGKGKKASKPGKKVKKRPGFEGSFKAKTGPKKK